MNFLNKLFSSSSKKNENPYINVNTKDNDNKESNSIATKEITNPQTDYGTFTPCSKTSNNNTVEHKDILKYAIINNNSNKTEDGFVLIEKETINETLNQDQKTTQEFAKGDSQINSNDNNNSDSNNSQTNTGNRENQTEIIKINFDNTENQLVIKEKSTEEQINSTTEDSSPSEEDQRNEAETIYKNDTKALWKPVTDLLKLYDFIIVKLELGDIEEVKCTETNNHQSHQAKTKPSQTELRKQKIIHQANSQLIKNNDNTVSQFSDSANDLFAENKDFENDFLKRIEDFESNSHLDFENSIDKLTESEIKANEMINEKFTKELEGLEKRVTEKALGTITEEKISNENSLSSENKTENLETNSDEDSEISNESESSNQTSSKTNVTSDEELKNATISTKIFDKNGQFINENLKNNTFWSNTSRWIKSKIGNNEDRWNRYQEHLIKVMTSIEGLAQIKLLKIKTEDKEISIPSLGENLFDNDGNINLNSIQAQGLHNTIIYAASTKQYLTAEMVIESTQFLYLYCKHAQTILTSENREYIKIRENFMDDEFFYKLYNFYMKIDSVNKKTNTPKSQAFEKLLIKKFSSF